MGQAPPNMDSYANEVELFNKWSVCDITVVDISLVDYIPAKDKYAVFVPHTAGRYQTKRFRKAQCPIVERLVNSLMMHGRNNGKKLMTVKLLSTALRSSTFSPERTPSRSLSMLSSTLDLG